MGQVRSSTRIWNQTKISKNKLTEDNFKDLQRILSIEIVKKNNKSKLIESSHNNAK